MVIYNFVDFLIKGCNMSLLPDERYANIERNNRTPNPTATTEYNSRMSEFNAAANNSTDPANMTAAQRQREIEVLSSGPITDSSLARLETLDRYESGNTSPSSSSTSSGSNRDPSSTFNTSSSSGSTSDGGKPGVGPGGEFNSSTGDFDKKMANFEKANEGVDSGWSNPRHNTANNNNNVNNTDRQLNTSSNNSSGGTAGATNMANDEAPASPNTNSNDSSRTTDSKYQTVANNADNANAIVLFFISFPPILRKIF